MITRYYICDNCDYQFTIKQSLHEPLKKRCPKCKKHKLYQDLTGQHAFVYQEPSTVGHLAERNRDRMGKYELESKEQKRGKLNKKTNKTWYNPEGKDLKQELKHLNTPEKKHKYIMEGKL